MNTLKKIYNYGVFKIFKVFTPTMLISMKNVSYARLVEIGRLDKPKVKGTYKAGQLFLNKILGYRGVILFPWHARMLIRDHSKSPAIDQKTQLNEEGIEGKTQIFYNVLIDSRDMPFIRAQSESVTFLGDHDTKTRGLYAIPGLDYIAHENVLPYMSHEIEPLRHELLDNFLVYRYGQEPQFTPKRTLGVWRKKNRSWLEVSDVYRETTENICVTVIPFYMGTRGSQTYWWRYSVCLQNMGDQSVRLRERHWRIFSLSGVLETVQGRGVVGQEPILSRSEPAFQYSSHVSLHTPSGHMWGTFRLEKEDGSTFDCRIPPFSLESRPHDSSGQEDGSSHDQD